VKRRAIAAALVLDVALDGRGGGGAGAAVELAESCSLRWRRRSANRTLNDIARERDLGLGGSDGRAVVLDVAQALLAELCGRWRGRRPRPRCRAGPRRRPRTGRALAAQTEPVV
jgi:hypothetical protein